MGKVVGVRFKPQGKSYDFDPGAFVVAVGDHVIVETEQGLGFGTVSRETGEVPDDEIKKPLKKIYRMATEEDFEQHQKTEELESQAHDYCTENIEKLKLPMNLFTVDATFDMRKLTFFFTAEGRVDFRELVKILVRHFRTRIELRQIGVRHQAKMCGGLGRCGREICCTSFMSNFAPVSVKMAKVQNLSLNPTKISGLCGRLMCCLTFEHETYKNLTSGLPKCGRTVETPEGRGRVVRHNVLRETVTVKTGGGSEVEVSPEELSAAAAQALEVGDKAPEPAVAEVETRPKPEAKPQKDSNPSARKRGPRKSGRRRKNPRQAGTPNRGTPRSKDSTGKPS